MQHMKFVAVGLASPKILLVVISSYYQRCPSIELCFFNTPSTLENCWQTAKEQNYKKEVFMITEAGIDKIKV